MSARAGGSPRWSSSFYYPLSQHNTGSGQAGRRERRSYRGREEGEREGAAHASAAELISESMSLLPALPPPTLAFPSLWPHRFLFGPAHPPLHTRHPAASTTHTHTHTHTHPSTRHPLVSSVNSSSCPPLLSCCPGSCNHISKPVKTSIVTVTGLFSCGGKMFLIRFVVYVRCWISCAVLCLSI